MNIKRSFAFGLAAIGVAALLVQPAMSQGGRPMGPPPGGPMGAPPGGRMGGHGGPGGPMMFGPGMMQELNLTAAQKSKVQKTTASYGSKIKAVFDNKKLSEAQKRTKVEALDKQMRGEIDKVLTAAQRKRLVSFRNRPHGMFEELNLTAAQKPKVQKIMASYGSKMKAVRDNKKLSEAQKRSKMEALHQQLQGEISKVLTAAQRKKMSQMRGPGGPFGGHPRQPRGENR